MILKRELSKISYFVFFIILISIGVGTASALITITLDGLVVFPEAIHIQSSLLDESGDAGTTGQVLSNTGTGVDWITPSGSETLSVIKRESGTITVQTGQSASRVASCLQGEIVTGGGFENTSLSGGPIIDYIGPHLTINDITGWRVDIFNDGFDSMTFKAIVMCVKLTP